MATDNIREKLSEITSNESSKWMEDAKWRRDNKVWLKKSQSIALRVLRALREKNMQQKDLAKALGVSNQQISKIVKGKENLTLDTISKLEQALGVMLFEVPKDKKTSEVLVSKSQFDFEYKSNKVHVAYKSKTGDARKLTGTLQKGKIVAVLRESKTALRANSMVYTPRTNNKYKEAA